MFRVKQKITHHTKNQENHNVNEKRQSADVIVGADGRSRCWSYLGKGFKAHHKNISAGNDEQFP